MRSVLVVLSLLAFIALPAEAGQKARTARQKKAAAMKKAQAGQKKVKPPVESTRQGAGTLGGTRRTHQDGSQGNLPRNETVVASSGSRTQARTVVRNRAQRRTATPTTTHQHESTVMPTSMAAAHTFDSSAAVAPRKKTGRVKRWFAALFVAGAVALGGYGWHAADMNSKVGDAWSYVTHVIQGNGGGGGGGHTNPIPPVPDGPQPPFPDPGPPSPDPGPGGNGPSGGHGHQTPHHPETDHRGG